MAFFDDVKAEVKVKNTTAYDNEVSELIASAKADLILSGLSETKVLETETLIARAIKLYAKANFGLDNPDSEKYQARYDSLKTHLCLSTDYTEA